VDVRCKIYLMLVEYSSIPLLIGFYMLYLSGYGLVTYKVRWLTLGLLGYRESILLHTGLLPYIVGIIMVLHAVGGFGLMINRRVKNPMLRMILELLNLLIVGVFIFVQLTLLALL
jgi:uncharacterized membrane protein (UPF0182 family)